MGEMHGLFLVVNFGWPARFPPPLMMHFGDFETSSGRCSVFTNIVVISFS